MLRLLYLEILMLFIFVGCGTPVCVVGFGDCAQMFANAPNTTASGTALNITGPTTVTLGTPVTYTATGGSGSYTFTVTTPAGCGSFSTTSIGFFSPSVVGSCTLQVTDTSNLVATTTVTIVN